MSTLKRAGVGTIFRPVLGIILFLLSARQASAQSFPYASCHLEQSQPLSYSAQLHCSIRFPRCDVEKWDVVAAHPAELPGQTSQAAVLSFDRLPDLGSPCLESSPLKRALLCAQVDDNTDRHVIAARIKYMVTLTPYRLVEGREASVDQSITAEDRLLFLRPTETINFKSAVFQKWLDAKDLRRQAGESDLQFAWRAYLAVRESFSYNYEATEDRHVSYTCRSKSTDCGGLSYLLAGTLRANRVPARTLVGRLARSDSEPGVVAGGCHVRLQFFAEGVGWIPVEISQAVVDKQTAPLAFFGQDSGDLITFHIDPDLVVRTELFGRQKVGTLQEPAVWVSGRGSVRGFAQECHWTVGKLVE